MRGTRPGEVISDHEESGDEVKLRIPMDNSSDEDDEEEKEDPVNKSISTNHVSTIKPASFFDSSETVPLKDDTLVPLNQTLDQAD